MKQKKKKKLNNVGKANDFIKMFVQNRNKIKWNEKNKKKHIWFLSTAAAAAAAEEKKRLFLEEEATKVFGDDIFRWCFFSSHVVRIHI